MKKEESGAPGALPMNFGTPGEYTIRFGEATEAPKKPTSLELSGRLSAPFDFLDNKHGNYNSKNCFLEVDRDKNMLTLTLNEKSEDTDHIKGCLSPDKNLSDFQINTSKRWTVKEFMQFIRERKYFFKDPGQQDKLIQSLQKWTVNIDRVIKEHNGNDGNSTSSLETKVSNIDVIREFNLDIPIYRGYAKESFKVEIGFEPKSTSVEMYLFSSELFELIMIKREIIFLQELAKFEKLGFACSVVNIS